tara:strand:- start:472 stop:669 length:198 start_codon:yes stop_codon:yes gene_type:complete
MLGNIFLYLVSKGRIFFGVLFLAPVLSQFLNYNKIENIIGIPTLILCLFIGFLWGLYATIKGSWF